MAKKYFKKISMASLSIAPASPVPQPAPCGGSDNPSRENSFQPSSRFELPKIQTPIFYGSYDTWPNFHDSFKSMCHDNNEIPIIEGPDAIRGLALGSPQM